MPQRTPKVDLIDSMIERAYYAQAPQGKQISVMNICPLFRDVRRDMETGIPLADAMTAAITKYCV